MKAKTKDKMNLEDVESVTTKNEDDDLDLYDDDENFSKFVPIKRHRRFDDNTSKNKNY